MGKLRIIKITRTLLDGIKYFVGFTKRGNRIVDIKTTSWADEAMGYRADAQIDKVINRVKKLDSSWGEYYFEGVDRESEIEETIPKFLREKRALSK